jgi:hypothetical protein
MNVKLGAFTIRAFGHTRFIIVRFGWFGFGHWKTKAIHYQEVRIGLFLIKIHA